MRLRKPRRHKSGLDEPAGTGQRPAGSGDAPAGAYVHQVLVAKRLAIVDDDGIERITLEVHGAQTRIVVRTTDSKPGESTGVQLVALSSGDDGPASVGIELTHRGSIASTLTNLG